MEHGKGILKLCGLAVCVLPWHSVLGPCTPGFPSHCCWDIFSISGRYLQRLLLCFTYLLASMQGSRGQVLKCWCKGRPTRKAHNPEPRSPFHSAWYQAASEALHSSIQTVLQDRVLSSSFTSGHLLLFPFLTSCVGKRL